jgi:hypothetical protein
MDRRTGLIVAVTVAVLLALGSALGWFSAVEAPGPAATAPASAPGVGGTTQQ